MMVVRLALRNDVLLLEKIGIQPDGEIGAGKAKFMHENHLAVWRRLASALKSSNPERRGKGSDAEILYSSSACAIAESYVPWLKSFFERSVATSAGMKDHARIKRMLMTEIDQAPLPLSDDTDTAKRSEADEVVSSLLVSFEDHKSAQVAAEQAACMLVDVPRKSLIEWRRQTRVVDPHRTFFIQRILSGVLGLNSEDAETVAATIANLNHTRIDI